MNLNYEKKLFTRGHKLIAGLDEAGRGALAGPVVAACVLIRPEHKINKDLKTINDSKQLTAKQREKMFKIIKENFEVKIGIYDNHTIDKINILQASLLAMKETIDSSVTKPDILLIDGNKTIKNLKIRQQAIIDGDAKIFSIAAASIIAKVTRDNIMQNLDKLFPQYGFNRNKGYGTNLHFESLKKFGPCILHRKTFEPIKSLFSEKK